jgi:hypothetical protein
MTRNKHLIKYSATGPNGTGFLLKISEQGLTNGNPSNSLVVRLWVLNTANSDQTLSIDYCQQFCDVPGTYMMNVTFDPITVTSKSFYELKLKISKLSNGSFQIKVGDQASPGEYPIPMDFNYLKLSFASANINISNVRYYIGK